MKIKKKRYFNRQKLKLRKNCIGIVSINIKPMIKNESFDCYVYSNETDAKIAIKRELANRKGLKTCICGRIIK